MSDFDLGAPDLPPDMRYTDAPPPSGPMDQLSAFGNAVHASYEAQRFDGDMFAKANAQSEAIDLRNAHIQRETGEQLENPLEGGYMKEARARGSAFDLVPSTDDALAVYKEKLDALEQQHPDKAYVIRAKTPVLEDARQLSDYWSQRAAKGEPGLNAVAGLGASFLGGAAGFFRNPVNIGLAVATGGIGGGATSLAAIVAREAAVNAGLQAVAEPGVQSFRAERGQEAGFVPALKEIGEAGLFGAGFGGLLHIGGRLLAQAVDHGEGVSQALPERPPATVPASAAPAAKGFDVSGPLSPAQEAAAHADNLGPAARAEAESGKVAPEIALETAKRVDGDAAQLATMRGAQTEMDASGARGTDAAAEAVSREMEAQTTPDALAAIHGLEEPTPAVPEPRFRREGERAQEAQSEALKDELEREVEARAEEAPPPQHLLSKSDQFEEVHNARLEKYGPDPDWDKINARAFAEFFADDEAAQRAGGKAAGAREGPPAEAGNLEAGAGARAPRDGAREDTRLLDLTPQADGAHLPLEEALKLPTRAEMLAKVVERCPL
jgi:hypothetical protein